MKEEWRFIPSAPMYHVSNLGEVRSFSKKHKGILLKKISHKGYYCVKIHNVRKYIHRLILETFIGPCPIDQECLHADGTRTNNRLDNLSWGTHTQNIKDARDTKAQKFKLNKENVIDIREKLKAGVTPIVLADQYSVSQATISDVKRGKTWT